MILLTSSMKTSGSTRSLRRNLRGFSNLHSSSRWSCGACVALGREMRVRAFSTSSSSACIVSLNSIKTQLLNTGPEASVELEDGIISSQMESRDIQVSKELVELMEEMDSMLMFDDISDSEPESELDSNSASSSDSDSPVISLDESSSINISISSRYRASCMLWLVSRRA